MLHHHHHLRPATTITNRLIRKTTAVFQTVTCARHQQHCCLMYCRLHQYPSTAIVNGVFVSATAGVHAGSSVSCSPLSFLHPPFFFLQSPFLFLLLLRVRERGRPLKRDASKTKEHRENLLLTKPPLSPSLVSFFTPLVRTVRVRRYPAPRPFVVFPMCFAAAAALITATKAQCASLIFCRNKNKLRRVMCVCVRMCFFFHGLKGGWEVGREGGKRKEGHPSTRVFV